MDNFVARQAIFDRKQNVYGYELLFRSSTDNGFDGSDASLATSQVIANTVFSIGLENMLSGKRALSISAATFCWAIGPRCCRPKVW